MSEGRAEPANKTVFVAGASGTIGRAVVRALVADGHRVIAQVRKLREPALAELASAEIASLDLGDPAALAPALEAHQPQVVISCIASRSGSPKDAMAVDYQANSDLLKAALEAGVEHFILLSAICVQRPKLAFQHAKLAFEDELKAAPIQHTIVRPTAFFKSLSGQVERVAAGKRIMVFGDGELTKCKPISDADLARFIAQCVTHPAKRGATLPIGGPGPAISPLDQRAMLEQALGKKVELRHISLKLLSRIGSVLSFGARFSPFARDWWAEQAEYLRIAQYYASESMLVLDPETGEYGDTMTPEFGEDRLFDHYKQLIEDER